MTNSPSDQRIWTTPGSTLSGRLPPHWNTSLEPRRLVVDQVCLVPDVPAFLEAIALWDERHFFPILIDEPALTLPFLRSVSTGAGSSVTRGRPGGDASSPRRRISNRRRVANMNGPRYSMRWLRAWSSPGVADHELPIATSRPRHLGPTPPGVIVTGPEAPMLAGAVALAAGRFQPLVRVGTIAIRAGSPQATPIARRFGDVLTLDERGFRPGIEARVAAVVLVTINLMTTATF